MIKWQLPKRRFDEMTIWQNDHFNEGPIDEVARWQNDLALDKPGQT